MGYWSQIEVHVGNICACMPAVYSLLQTLWPGLAGSTKGSATDPKRSSKVQSSPNSAKVGDDEQNFVRLDDIESKGGASHSVNSVDP